MDIGRNVPCPCGNGKKFKKCCLGRTDSRSGSGAMGNIMRDARDNQKTIHIESIV